MKRLLFSLILGLPLIALADPGYVTEATELRDGPYADAKSVADLPDAATVEIRGRQGGWYQVQLGDKQGWVRMSSLRLRAPGARAGVLEGGRSVATQSVATTAVRGMNAVQIQNAVPDIPAVDALENSAVTADAARGYAADGGLKAKAKGDE